MVEQGIESACTCEKYEKLDMPKTFFIALAFSVLFYVSIFVSKMLTAYRGIDYPYLLYALAIILFVSSVSACFVSKLITDSGVGASVYSIIISFFFYMLLIYFS